MQACFLGYQIMLMDWLTDKLKNDYYTTYF